MTGFQQRLQKQITRFSLLLSGSFFLIFMGILFIYSIYFNSYRAENYNRVLAKEFTDMYQQYEAYLSQESEGPASFLKCLKGKMSGTSLSLVYRSFARGCLVNSNLILTDREGQIASTTYADPSYSQKAFNAHVAENALAQDQGIYHTVYYFEGEPRYVFAQPVYQGDTLWGVACLYLDSNTLTYNMRTLQYSGIIVHDESSVVVAADRRLVESLNHFSRMKNGRFSLEGQDYWMYSSQLPQYGVAVYTYVGMIPIWGYYLVGLVVSVFLFFAVMLVFLLVTKSLAQHSAASVKTLQAQIDSVAVSGAGLLDLPTGDEFENIAQHINEMLLSTRQLSRRNLELLRLNTDMEVRTLEAKFNPHFLYNTLESIRFAIQMGMEGADNALVNLTRLLRYRVGNTGGEVALEEDLPHLLSYLGIIKFRFGERFTYTMDLAPECLSRRVPKLLLQPVLENSVNHGFRGRTNVALQVTGTVDGNQLLCLTVTDNGAGIPPNRLAQLQEKLRHPTETPEGEVYSELHSTARRLYLQYGGESRMEIDSIPGVKTTVVVLVAEGGGTYGVSGDDSRG